MADDYLENREDLLASINENFKLIKTNCKGSLKFTEEVKGKLTALRIKNQLLIRNAYIHNQIDSLLSMLNDLMNATELIDIIRELKNNKKQALDLINLISQLIAENSIESNFEVKTKGGVLSRWRK